MLLILLYYSNYKNNTQLNNDYYTKTEIDANNWIDNTALARVCFNFYLNKRLFNFYTNSYFLL